MKEGPLDMRMDPRQKVTAARLINELSSEELASIFYRYGEIRGSRRLADAVVRQRPINTTNELATVIKACTKGPNQMRILAQVFQALRIEVNGELEMLEKALPIWLDLLAPGGRLGVISFHSLEDRIVKQFFAEHGGNRFDSELNIITKQPLSGTEHEIVFNPRSRSAKLRVAQRK
jgi:16S rRNA (cytosine1402-N4)-methyltransferase